MDQNKLNEGAEQAQREYDEFYRTNRRGREKLDQLPKLFRKSFYRFFFKGEKTRAKAIKQKCLDCTCWDRGEIAKCAVKFCALYDFRPYKE